MVKKPVAAVGAVLILLGIAMTASIMVLEEWVVVTVPGEKDGVGAACEAEPLGTLGLYTATYNPACTEGKKNGDGEDYPFNRFELEESGTTNFWPLFPAQAGFAGLFGDDLPEFDNCKDYFAAAGPAVKAAEEFIDAAIIAPGFDAIDAGMSDVNDQIYSQAGPTLEIIDRLIPTLFAGSLLEVYDGLNNQSIVLTNGLNELETGLNAFITNVNLSPAVDPKFPPVNFSSAMSDTVDMSPFFSPLFGGEFYNVAGSNLYAQFFDLGNWNSTRFIRYSICAEIPEVDITDQTSREGCIDGIPAAEIAERIDQFETLIQSVGGLFAPLGNPAGGLKFAFVTSLADVTKTVDEIEFDGADSCSGTIYECATVSNVASADALSEKAPYERFIERVLFLQLAGLFGEAGGLFNVVGATATLQDNGLSRGFLESDTVKALLDARAALQVCSSFPSIGACAELNTNFNGLPANLNTTWQFCELASQSLLEGLIDTTPFDGQCNVIAALSGLAAGLQSGAVSLSGAGPEAEAAIVGNLPVIPLLLETFVECANGGVLWDVTYKAANESLTFPLSYPINRTADNCQAAFTNPGLFSDPKTDFDQQTRSPQGAAAWVNTRSAGCFAVRIPNLIRNFTAGNPLIPEECETFNDFLNLAAVEGLNADSPFAPFVEFNNRLASGCRDISLAPEGPGAAVLGSPNCEDALIAASGAGAVPFALLALDNFYSGTEVAGAENPADGLAFLVDQCEDDELDAKAIKTAQVMVPAGLGLMVVGLILGLVTLAKGKKPLAIAAGAFSVLGGGLVLAALLIVQAAPVYQGVGSADECPDFEACYQAGLANLLGLLSIATPILGGFLLIGASCCGGSEEEESKVATSSY